MLHLPSIHRGPDKASAACRIGGPGSLRYIMCVCRRVGSRERLIAIMASVRKPR